MAQILLNNRAAPKIKMAKAEMAKAEMPIVEMHGSHSGVAAGSNCRRTPDLFLKTLRGRIRYSGISNGITDLVQVKMCLGKGL